MKTILLVIVLVIISPVLMISQKQGQEKIDSLLKELPKAKEDTNKVNLLEDISYEYCFINPDRGLVYASQCLALAEELNWKNGIALAFNNYGVNYQIKSQYSKALEYYFKSLKLNEDIGDKRAISANMVNIGLIYFCQSDYPKALEYHFKSLRITEKLGNKQNIAACLGRIGNIYSSQSNYSKALEYYFKALKINEDIRNKLEIALNLGNIGIIYSDQSDYPKALDFYFKAINIYEDLGNKRGIAINLANIGNIYKNQSNYPKALEYYIKSLKIDEILGNKSGIAYVLCNIGELYINLSQDTNFTKIHERNEFVGLTKEINLRKGISYLTRSAEIVLEIEDLGLLGTVYAILSQGYFQLKDYKNAYEYNEKSWKLKDSIFSFENQKKFKNLESARELEKKEAEIKIYQINDKFQKSAIWGASSLVLIVIFFLYVVWRQRRKSEKLLLNILPAKIATRLKKKEHPIADQFDEASVVFIDIVDFTKSSSNSDPKRVAEVLNTLYSKLDTLAKKHGLEKIKTIGDCYMAAAGIPIPDKENTIKAAAFATDAMTMLKDYNTGDGTILNFRCGLDCGPVVAGVIGENKFIYDLWGDIVNTASRMESNGVEGKIQCTERFKEKVEQIPLNPPFSKGESAAGGLLPFSKGESTAERFIPLSNVESSGLPSLEKGGQGGFFFEERGEIEIKGKGMMKTWFLENIN